MLGENIGSEGWPSCGEIDIMELVGGGSFNDRTIYGTEQPIGAIMAHRPLTETPVHCLQEKYMQKSFMCSQ